MENSVWRRLNALSRHLLIQYEANEVLHSNCLSSLNELRHVESEPVIIGGMVLDIHATPSTPIHPRTTTPGKVHYVFGGVARNVAECISKLGTKPFMISIVGLDMAGNLLLEYWKSAGLTAEGIQRCQDIGTPVVCNLFDDSGELAAAVASVEAIEIFLTKEWIQKFRCNICSTQILMVDANLNPCSLEASCQTAESGIPVWFEPVSVAKSKRVTSVVKHITFTSPNEDELIAMANALSCGDGFHPIQRVAKSGSRQTIEYLFQMLRPAIMVLLEKGIKLVVVTLGSDGVFLCSKDGPDFTRYHSKNAKPNSFARQLYDLVTSSCPPNKFVSATKFERRTSHLFVLHFPALRASVVRLTGAGDCLVGGILASICAGLDLMQSIAVGIASAKAAVEVETNVPSQYCLARIADDARLIYFSATVVCDQPLV